MSIGHRNPESNWSDTSTVYRLSESKAQQQDQTRQALESFMAALKAQDQKALVESKSMPVWCKHCEHGFSLMQARVNKEEECFQLKCPRCQELIIQVRTRHTAALGFLARMFSVGQASINELAGHEEDVKHCLWAFRRHDYRRCVELASPLVKVSTHSYLTQVLIISAQRLDLNDVVEQVGRVALGPAAHHSPWEATLLKLTLGLVGPEEAMKAARSDVDRCRVLFYHAARLITLHDKRQAKQLLNQCLRFEVSCEELTLVSSELELT